MAYTTKKGKDLWQSLWWAKSQAEEAALEVMRGCVLAVVETGKYSDQPFPLQVSQALAFVHDAYYQGRKWQFDFDAKLYVVPGKRYYARTLQSVLNQHVFEFMDEPYSPFKQVPAKGVNWANSFEIPVVHRDIAGAMFGVVEETIMKAPSVVYPLHWRMIKKHVFDMEAA